MHSKPIALLNEGKVILPNGYVDRTAHVFTPVVPGAGAINITRDVLNVGDTPAAYIERQLALLTQHLKSWQLQQRAPVWLGDRLIEGERLQASFERDGVQIYQQQAIFGLGENRLLAFSMMQSSAPGEQDIAAFNQLLQSFTFHQ
ncbi:DUF1795 domain-containing protein [Paramixta manurensis]|uniref:DUF1795 domain-containing protein n=1 Tax=Paramixta manurensis TaxID=2740817 RepID=A0A6M8U6P2_9GAMM|nr:DUF1795 domain-containing protein [Erwiniaceae bacterium PD-1]